jgi:hypothetical protein
MERRYQPPTKQTPKWREWLQRACWQPLETLECGDLSPLCFRCELSQRFIEEPRRQAAAKQKR